MSNSPKVYRGLQCKCYKKLTKIGVPEKKLARRTAVVAYWVEGFPSYMQSKRLSGSVVAGFQLAEKDTGKFPTCRYFEKTSLSSDLRSCRP